MRTKQLRTTVVILVLIALVLTACAGGGGGTDSTPSPGGSTSPQTPGATADQGFQGETIKIGIVTFLSGAAASPFGVPSRNAAEVLIEQLNAGNAPAPYDQVGLGGKLIEAVYIDENGGADKQVAEFRRLVLDEKVDVVIGYVSSSDCLAVAPVAEELQKLTILYDCGTQQIFEEQDHQYVFRTAGHQVLDSIGAARYVADLDPGIATYTGINQNYSWGQDSWNAFRASMEALLPDAEALSPQFPNLGQGEYSAEISSLLNQRPDVIHTSFWGGDTESLIIQSAPRNLHQGRYLVATAAETLLPRFGSSMPEGLIVGGRGPHGAFAPDTELNRWFVEEYRNRHGMRPVYPSYHMAQAILGLKAAYEKAAAAGPVDQDAVMEALTYLEFDTPSGMIKMALGNGHQAVEGAAYGMTGKFDPALGEVALTQVKYYPPECVLPPEGTTSEDWIKAGFPGAQCP